MSILTFLETKKNDNNMILHKLMNINGSTRKRKASMRVILATASWKSSWMNRWKGAVRITLRDVITTDNIVFVA
jgi:hypothetical protein